MKISAYHIPIRIWLIKNYIFLIACFLSALCFLPVLFVEKSSDNIDQDFLERFTTDVTGGFKISIAMACPVLTKYFLEVLYSEKIQSNRVNFKVSIMLAIMLLVLIDALVLSEPFTNNLFIVMPSVHASQKIMTFWCILEIFNTYLNENPLIRAWYILPFIIFSVSQILSCIMAHSTAVKALLYLLLGLLQCLFLLIFIKFLTFAHFECIKIERAVDWFKSEHTRSLSYKRQLVILLECIMVCFVVYTIIISFTSNAGSTSMYYSLHLVDVFIPTIILVFAILLHDMIENIQKLLAQIESTKTMKSTLAKYLSHQIRTPLNSVALGLICLKSNLKKVFKESKEGQEEKAGQSDNSDDLTEIVRDTFSSCVTANTILDNVVVYENISAGTLVLTPSFQPAKSLVQSALESFKDEATDRNITLEIFQNFYNRWNVESICTYVDVQQITKAIKTIISNAMKYTKKGGKVTIHAEIEYIQRKSDINTNNYQSLLSTRRSIAGSRLNKFLSKKRDLMNISTTSTGGTEEAIGKLVLRVIDNGVGINESAMEDLFHKTIRFKTGEEEQLQGSGLSLWIAYRLVKMHKGCHLEAMSRGEGHGAEFSLSIPIYSHSEEESISPSLMSPMSPSDLHANLVDERAQIAQQLWHINRDSRQEGQRRESKRKSAFRGEPRLNASMYVNANASRVDSASARMGVRTPSPGIEQKEGFHIGLMRSKSREEGKVELNHSLSSSSRLLGSGSAIIHPGSESVSCSPVGARDFLHPLEEVDSTLTSPAGDTKHPQTCTDQMTEYMIRKETLELDSLTELCVNKEEGVVEAFDDNDCISGRSSLDSKSEFHSRRPSVAIHRVLVVDDAPMNRKMIVRMLNGRCDVIDQAEDGVVAVKNVQESIEKGIPYDFVLMDYQMPNCDGASAVQIMRESEYSAPVIGVTGNATSKDIQTYLSNGADAVLTKPLDVITLEECLAGYGIYLPSF